VRARTRADHRHVLLDRTARVLGPHVFTEIYEGDEQMATRIDRDELHGPLADDDSQLVEVLPRDEYEDEHLPGSTNIPLMTLNTEATRRLDRRRPVIVY
jgi:hypothetical protein